MAFNINIPGPKLIDLDLSTKLGDLGTTFRQNRDEAYAKDIFANLDLNDPAQVDRAVTQLAHLPQYAGLAQRIAESHQRAQERAATESIQRDYLGIAKSKEQREIEDTQRQIEAGKKFEAETAAEDARAEQARQERLRGRPAAPAPVRTFSEDEPTTYTPGGEAVKTRWWEEPAKPATPGPQSGLGGVSPLAAVGAMRAEPSPAELGVLPDTALGPSARGPQFAQAAGATRTDAVGGVPVRPVAGGTREPQLQEPSEEEIAYEERARRFNRRAADPSINAQQSASFRAIAAQAEKDRQRLEDQRHRIYNKRSEAIEKRQSASEKIEEEPKKKLIEKILNETQAIDKQEATLSQLAEIAKSPQYQTGLLGGIERTGASLLSQLGVRGSPTMAPGLLSRSFDSLSKRLTIEAAGEKGLGAQGFAVSDREFVAAAGPSVDDPAETAQTKIAIARAVNERKRQIIAIQRKGIALGKKTNEIDEAVATFAEENPLFAYKDGGLTPLGKRVNPALARSADSETASAAQTREKKASETGGGRTPSRDAIEYLRKNPGTARDFESHYGLSPGSAQQYLGGV